MTAMREREANKKAQAGLCARVKTLLVVVSPFSTFHVDSPMRIHEVLLP
jgi:hypothetical protein